MALTKWQGLSDHFRQNRGEGLAYKTIQAWQSMGMPYIRQSKHRVFFNPEDCWQWYLERFTVEKAG